jgi:hypothetical protein
MTVGIKKISNEATIIKLLGGDLYEKFGLVMPTVKNSLNG